MKSIEHRTDKIYMLASVNIALVAGIILSFTTAIQTVPACCRHQIRTVPVSRYCGLIYHKTYIKQCQATAIIAVMKYMSPLVISSVSYIMSNILSGSFYN